MSDWKTTVFGVLLGLSQAAKLAPIPPPFSWIPDVIGAFAAVMLGKTAADAGK